jgi:hypothetical protein
MAKDPAARPASAAAVRDRLRALRGPQPVDLPPRTPKERRLALVLVALVVIAAVAIGVYAVLANRDSGGQTDAVTTPSADATTSSSSSASSSPVSGYEVRPGDEEKAVASMGAAFAESLGITDEQASCTAQSTIQEAGLQHLVDIGMFDSEMAFHDLDLAPYPEVKSALTSASLTCAGV